MNEAPGPFSPCGVTRLLARQGLPFVNGFPENQHYQGPIAQCTCVYVITCTSTCSQGEDATHRAEREKQRNACWELQLVF